MPSGDPRPIGRSGMVSSFSSSLPGRFSTRLPVEFVRAIDVTPTPTNLRVTNCESAKSISHGIFRRTRPPISPGTSIATASRSRRRRSSFRRRTPISVSRPRRRTSTRWRPSGCTADLPSQQSDPVGATTTAGTVVRVPQDFPTIQAAIDAAGPMTSIHVAPGTYTEPMYLANKYGITIKGQDANGCILDYSGALRWHDRPRGRKRPARQHPVRIHGPQRPDHHGSPGTWWPAASSR